MSLQMDFNPKFSPSDWLLVQRKEFYKERNGRWKSTYDKSFYDSERYSGGADANGHAPDIRDMLNLQMTGTMNPIHANPHKKSEEVQQREADEVAQRKWRGAPMPRPEVAAPPSGTMTPQSQAAGSSTNARGPSPLFGGTSMQSPNRSMVRLDPVRTWQAEAEKFPAMRHATSDSMIAKVYTSARAVQGMQAAGGTWRNTMTQRGSKDRENPDEAGFGGCKRTSHFTVEGGL